MAHPRRTRRTDFLRTVLQLAFAAAVALTTRASFADHYRVPSGSMEPNVHVGDHIVVAKAAYGLRLPLTETYLLRYAKPARGDVVVIAPPDAESRHDADIPGTVLLKRVVAVEGDLVEVRDGHVTIDGKRVVEPTLSLDWGGAPISDRSSFRHGRCCSSATTVATAATGGRSASSIARTSSAVPTRSSRATATSPTSFFEGPGRRRIDIGALEGCRVGDVRCLHLEEHLAEVRPGRGHDPRAPTTGAWKIDGAAIGTSFKATSVALKPGSEGRQGTLTNIAGPSSSRPWRLDAEERPPMSTRRTSATSASSSPAAEVESVAMPLPSSDDVLHLWFDGASATELGSASSRWFKKDEAFDGLLRDRFGDALEAAARGELGGWCSSPRGSLALVVLCDQFARNVFRNTARSFAYDALALSTSLGSRARGEDAALTIPEQTFLAMPLMHSESLAMHDEATRVFAAIVARAEREVPSLVGYAKSNVGYEAKHRALLDRFGRYPHRNAVVGRASTPEELVFLASESGF